MSQPIRKVLGCLVRDLKQVKTRRKRGSVKINQLVSLCLDEFAALLTRMRKASIRESSLWQWELGSLY